MRQTGNGRRTLNRLTRMIRMRFLIALLALIGCASRQPSYSATDLRTPVATIIITNDYRDDVRAWVVHGTVKHRQLGIVPRYEMKVFVLEEGDFDQGTLQIVTVTATERASSYTERVAVVRG